MKVAVITPYYNTPREWLVECHQSVLNQTHPCTHFMVSDGDADEHLDTFDAQHIRLPINHDDFGDTPRGVGSVSAIGQGYDAIAYLDADNWYEPEHVRNMVEHHRKTGAAVITSARNIHRLDGSFMKRCTQVDGKTFVDVNCFFLTRNAYRVVPTWWMIDPRFHALDDRILWLRILSSRISHAHYDVPTAAYRTAFKEHYQSVGEEPPPGTKGSDYIKQAMAEFNREQIASGNVSIVLNP